jgi:hypothetical protein
MFDIEVKPLVCFSIHQGMDSDETWELSLEHEIPSRSHSYSKMVLKERSLRQRHYSIGLLAMIKRIEWD